MGRSKRDLIPVVVILSDPLSLRGENDGEGGEVGGGGEEIERGGRGVGGRIEGIGWMMASVVLGSLDSM